MFTRYMLPMLMVAALGTTLAAQVTVNGTGGGPFGNSGGGGVSPGSPASVDVEFDVNIPAGETVTAVTITVSLLHEWAGDVSLTLEAPDGSTHQLLIGPLGGGTFGTSNDFGVVGTLTPFLYTFSDQATQSLWDVYTVNPIAAGTYRTTTADGQTNTSIDAAFVGLSSAAGQGTGTWTLTASDSFVSADGGAVNAAASSISVFHTGITNQNPVIAVTSDGSTVANNATLNVTVGSTVADLDLEFTITDPDAGDEVSITAVVTDSADINGFAQAEWDVALGAQPGVTAPTTGVFDTLGSISVVLNGADDQGGTVQFTFTIQVNAHPVVIGVTRGTDDVANGELVYVHLNSTVAALGLEFTVSQMAGTNVDLDTTVTDDSDIDGFVQGEWEFTGQAQPASATPTTGVFDTLGEITVALEADGTGGQSAQFTFTIRVIDADPLLYDNGPLATGDTLGASQAPDGYRYSALQNVSLGLNTLGFGVQQAGATDNRLADDFEVPAGEEWEVTSLTFYVYSTSGGATPPVGEVFIQILDDAPSTGTANVLFGDLTTDRLADQHEARIYRAAENNVGTTRSIWAVTAEVSPGLNLQPGTYWVVYTTVINPALTSGPWAPPVTILGEVGKPGANAEQHLAGSGWATLADTGTGTPAQDIPFKVRGISTPLSNAPVITSTAVTDASVGVAYSYQVTATGNPAPTFSAAGIPGGSWLSFNATTGEFSGTPGVGDVGVLGPITVTATNGNLPDDEQIFSITVTQNAPPTLTVTSTGAGVAADQTLTVTINSDVVDLDLEFEATDPDADDVTITTTVSPSGNIDGFVQAEWDDTTASATANATPTSGEFDTAGLITVVVTAEDAHGATTSLRFFIFVNDPASTNTAPVAQIPTAGSAFTGNMTSGFTYTGNVNVALSNAVLQLFDADGDAIDVVSEVGSVPGVTLPGPATGIPSGDEGEWTGTPTQAGTFVVTYTITDNNTAPVSFTITFNITTAPTTGGGGGSSSSGCSTDGTQGLNWLLLMGALAALFAGVRVARQRA